MKKMMSKISGSGYETPECEMVSIDMRQVLCASTKDGQIDDLFVEDKDPFTWV